MDNADRKDQPGLTKVEDLERVVRVREVLALRGGVLEACERAQHDASGRRSVSEDRCVLFGTGGHRRYQ